MRKYFVAPGRQQMTIWSMRTACWIPKNTDASYVKLIASPLQQWLNKSTSMSCYTYIACLLKIQILAHPLHDSITNLVIFRRYLPYKNSVLYVDQSGSSLQ